MTSCIVTALLCTINRKKKPLHGEVLCAYNTSIYNRQENDFLETMRSVYETTTEINGKEHWLQSVCSFPSAISKALFLKIVTKHTNFR